MRILTTLVLITMSSIAFACPDLAGSYACKTTTSTGNTSESKTTITQAVNNQGFTEYVFKTKDEYSDEEEDTLIADNVERETVDDLITIKTKTYCDKNSNSLVVRQLRILDEAGYKVTSLVTMHKVNSDNFIINLKVTSDEPQDTITGKIECTK